MTYQGPMTRIRSAALHERPEPPALALLARPRLLDVLQSQPLRSVVLVAAPAGSGKTAVLAQWVDAQKASGSPASIAWTTCEPGGASADPFWAAVQDALDGAGVPRADDDGPTREAATDAFEAAKRILRRVQAAPNPVVLIVDDFHLVTDSDAQAGVGYLADHAGDGFRLLISSRFDPNVGLTRIRLAGDLIELRLADLAMTTDEVFALIRASGLDLGRAEAAAIRERTEGWVAGIRLCLMSMSASGEPQRIVHELASNDSTIAGYLIEQVLAEIDPELRIFLLETSIVDVVTPSLAEELTGRPEAASMLRRLTRRTGFVSLVGDVAEGHRYHALFADLLRSEFRLTDRARHDELQTRVAEMLMRDNRPAEALSHAVTAENWDVAAAALFAAAVNNMGAGQETDLAPWLDKFPDTRIRTDPRLSLVTGGLAMVSGEVDTGLPWLALTASSLGEVEPIARRHISALHTILLALGSRLTNDHEDVLRLLDASGPPREPAAPAGSEVIDASIRACWHAMRAASLLRTGMIGDARETASRALRIAGTTVRWSAVSALETLALVAVVDGDLACAKAYSDEAIQRLRSSSAPRWRYSTTLYVCQVWIALDEGRFEAAEKALASAREVVSGDPDLLNSFILAAINARLAIHRDGDALGARNRMAGMDVSRVATTWLLDRLVASITVDYLVGLGRYAEAHSVAEHQQLKAPVSSVQHDDLVGWIRQRELLSYVKSHGMRSAQTHTEYSRDWARHREFAEAVMEAPSPIGAAGLLRVRRLLTAALIEFHAGDDGTASRLVNLVLDQVAVNGWRLPFYELGDTVHALLKSERDRINEHSELLAHLLQELQGHDIARLTSLVAPLSDREKEILQYLPTALDREELCATLFISKNTLKSHLRSIYRKLGADSRREAVHKARSLDLL